MIVTESFIELHSTPRQQLCSTDEWDVRVWDSIPEEGQKRAVPWPPLVLDLRLPPE